MGISHIWVGCIWVGDPPEKGKYQQGKVVPCTTTMMKETCET